jgi:ABC-type branched-subunit amino acid transport system permease subunit
MGGVVALLVLVPALLALARVGRLSATQAQTIAYAAAGLAGVAVLVGTFPLGPREAVHAVVFLAVLAGILAAALAGLLLGLPAIRLREDYLAIVTIGAAEILRQVTLNEHWLTRGSLGFPRLERPLVTWAQTSPFWESAADLLGVRRVALAQTVVTLAALAYAFLVLELLTRSPWGRVLKAIREDEAVAASLGKNASRFKLQSLMIGSGIAALAGVLLVWHLASVYPEHFIHQITFFAFVIIIVGGLGNHKGALIGAVILWTVFEAARNLTFLSRFGLDNLAGAPQSIAVGLLIILVMMFRPQGLVGRKEELAHVR